MKRTYQIANMAKNKISPMVDWKLGQLFTNTLSSPFEAINYLQFLLYRACTVQCKYMKHTNNFERKRKNIGLLNVLRNYLNS